MSMLGLLDYFGERAGDSANRYTARIAYEMARLVATATVTQRTKQQAAIPRAWADLTQREQALWISAAKHVLGRIRDGQFSESEEKELVHEKG